MPYSEKQIAEWAGNLADSDLWNRPARIEAIEKAARTLIAAVRKETREECEFHAAKCDSYQWEALPEDQREGMSKETTYALGHAAGVLAAVAAIRNLQEREEGKT